MTRPQYTNELAPSLLCYTIGGSILVLEMFRVWNGVQPRATHIFVTVALLALSHYWHRQHQRAI